jgi:cation diffusion facilitator CzcD-associated flavoprotein CzcO
MSSGTLKQQAMHLGGGPATDFDVVIVGAGFAGLCALHHLRQRGFSARIFEAGGGVGGTWYWNRYPGVRVDIESVEYSFSFSEELQQEWQWSERYAAQPELLRYVNHVADRFGLRNDIQLNTRVQSAAFDEATHQWVVRTSDGKQSRARFCVMATGFVSAANKPDIKDLASFAGKQYHTAHWPHEGVDFSGQRVGIIGTGSSGIQSIPLIAKQAAHLTVFQRTANFSIPLRNCPMDPEFERSVKANYAEWRRIERASFGGYVSVNFKPAPGNTRRAMEATPEERQQEYEYRWNSGGLCYYTSYADLLFSKEANDTLADFVRAKIREKVRDPVVAEMLIPRDYPIMTKRLCADTNYYETYNRDNVTLVDIKATPIEEVTAKGIRVGGVEHELDSIVFATGFDAVTGAMNRIDIGGRGGKALKQHWADGPRTYVGLMSAGFPNLFIIDGPGSPGAFFQPILLSEFQVHWMVDCVAHLRDRDLTCIEPPADAEQDWVAHVSEIANQTLFPLANSWYMGANIPGKARVSLMYLGGFGSYRQHCEEAAANGYGKFLLSGELQTTN